MLFPQICRQQNNWYTGKQSPKNQGFESRSFWGFAGTVKQPENAVTDVVQQCHRQTQCQTDGYRDQNDVQCYPDGIHSCYVVVVETCSGIQVGVQDVALYACLMLMVLQGSGRCFSCR